MNGRFGLSLSFSLSLLLVAATMSQMLQQVQGRRKFCGEALNEALDLICVNGFSRRIKRNNLVQAPNPSVERSQRGPARKWVALLHKLDALPPGTGKGLGTPGGGGGGGGNNGHNLRRHRRRIAHECCRDGCTYEDIVEYCA
ncbi:probable insulin-like peptide 4 isoform X1 [Drosophila subobscura]|uniref:probable insulin-like peptide 4 isoform X1 n=1 Tax=Drosophila subobscura TaxID=7241 RepID=UPI00155A76FF|nr:probable insulin-like peptide 4 isoform X1 [Drosophila subobscura]